ncbi:MAG: glycosyltransferase family 4 protein [Bacillota bacterium]
MRIGIDARVASWHIGSGLGNYTSHIISNLKEIDHNNKYVLFYPEGKGSELAFTFNSFRRDMGERKKDFWKMIYRTNWEEKTRVDIFHNTINGIGLPRKKRHKLVLTVHDLIPYVMPETVDKPHLDYVLRHTPYAIDAADKIITVSHHSKKDIRRYFDVPNDKIEVIYHAADSIYQPMEKKDAKTIVEELFHIRDKFILYLGGFSPRKNLTRLIRAFHKICNEFDEAYKLVILGEPSRTYENLNKLAEKLSIRDKIIFTGFVPTKYLPAFYNACECFVYPSLYEGFGLPPIEAAACGTPVITSNVSSMPEVMGNTCVYLNPYDVVDMAQTIYDTVTDQDLMDSLKQRSLDHGKKYSWKDATQKTLSIYNGLI